MKKDLIFAPIMLVIGLLLFLFKLTGTPVHIALSVVGVAVLVVYAVLTRKEWKIPALEIAMRALYGVALITGAVVMGVKDVLAIAIIHKVFAGLFAIALLVLFIHKLVSYAKK